MTWDDLRPRTFRGKTMFVIFALALAGIQIAVAVALIAIGLVPAGITLIVIVTVGCPLFLWYCWKE